MVEFFVDQPYNIIKYPFKFVLNENTLIPISIYKALLYILVLLRISGKK